MDPIADQVAKMAKAGRLRGFNDLAYIDKYAARFGIDPDEVIKKSFLTVMNFLWMWKEQEEFQKRYAKYDKMINDA